jgi:hypothetical protein
LELINEAKTRPHVAHFRLPFRSLITFTWLILSSSMSPSPTHYTPFLQLPSQRQIQTPSLSQQILLLAANVLPYILITIISPPMPSEHFAALFLTFWVLHFFALPYIVAHFYSAVDLEFLLVQQRKLWTAGNFLSAIIAVGLGGVLN